MKQAIAAAVILGVGFSAFAEVRLPALFGDNMILQQRTKNAVWGWAGHGETVTVTASWGAETSVKTGPEGKWKVFLPTPTCGTGHALTISGKNSIKIKNVAIGEVWLCAGQSNMGWALGNCFEGEAEAASANLLYNKEGLPASPFRTDNWPLFTPEDKIVIVDKPEKPEDGKNVEAD